MKRRKPKDKLLGKLYREWGSLDAQVFTRQLPAKIKRRISERKRRIGELIGQLEKRVTG